MHSRWSLALLLLTVAAAVVSTQSRFSETVRAFIKVDAPIVALTNVRVIDGSGAPARAGQTIVIKAGRIAEVGDQGASRRRKARRSWTLAVGPRCPGS